MLRHGHPRILRPHYRQLQQLRAPLLPLATKSGVTHLRRGFIAPKVGLAHSTGIPHPSRSSEGGGIGQRPTPLLHPLSLVISPKESRLHAMPSGETRSFCCRLFSSPPP